MTLCNWRPSRTEKKPRTRIKPVSDKKAAALLANHGKQPPRTPVKKRNLKRHSENRARAYGPAERRAFVKSLPCVVISSPVYAVATDPARFCEGPIVQAHVGNKGAGTGRKANADQVVPMCAGHHDLCHNGQETFERYFDLDLDALAAETEAAWLAHVAALEIGA